VYASCDTAAIQRSTVCPCGKPSTLPPWRVTQPFSSPHNRTVGDQATLLLEVARPSRSPRSGVHTQRWTGTPIATGFECAGGSAISAAADHKARQLDVSVREDTNQCRQPLHGGTGGLYPDADLQGSQECINALDHKRSRPFDGWIARRAMLHPKEGEPA
jgi:hypothetical protein